MSWWAPAFVQHALLAGLPIAVAAGLAGFFLVLRGQVFSGDALSHVAFTGALGALALGVRADVGLFASTIGGGALLALLGGRGGYGGYGGYGGRGGHGGHGEMASPTRTDDVVIGVSFAWILGLGVLALAVYSTSARAAGDGAAGVHVLFGSIFGLDLKHAVTAALASGGVIAVLMAVGRPLLFASVDPAVAAARGLPVRWLGVVFLAAVGATAGVATQAMGALLILGLLAAPAGAASHLTTNPYAGMAISVAIATFSMAAGLTISATAPTVPPSFAIIAVASGCYLLSALSPLPSRGR